MSFFPKPICMRYSFGGHSIITGFIPEQESSKQNKLSRDDESRLHG